MPYIKCAVRDCLSSSSNTNLHFFRFPLAEYRCNVWTEACGRNDLIGKTSAQLTDEYVCNIHFASDHMYGRQLLKPTATPTLTLPTKCVDSIYMNTEQNELLENERQKEFIPSLIVKNDTAIQPFHKIHDAVGPLSSTCENLQSDPIESVVPNQINEYHENQTSDIPPECMENDFGFQTRNEMKNLEDHTEDDSEESTGEEDPLATEIRYNTPTLHVYSTRLDDMTVFKEDFNALPIQSIVQRIIAESKPKQRSHVQNTYEKEMYAINYSRLVYKIEQFNALVSQGSKIDSIQIESDETDPSLLINKQSKELHQLCKPLFIKLVDINASKHGNSKTIAVKQQSSLNTNDIKLNANKFCRLRRIKDARNKTSDTQLVLKNLYMGNTEIYYIYANQMMADEYYCVDSVVKDVDLCKYLKHRYIVELVNCCWCKSEENIKFLCPKYFLENNTLHWFLKKPHTCWPTCSCCCYDNYNRWNKTEATILTNNQLGNQTTTNRADLLTNTPLNVPKNYPKTVLNQALLHHRNVRAKKDYLKRNLQAFNLVLHTRRGMEEHYISGPVNVKNLNIKVKNICCFYKRMKDCTSLPRYISKIITQMHTCTDYCNCCCIPFKKRPNISKLQTETSDGYYMLPKHVYNYGSNSVGTWKQIRKCQRPPTTVTANPLAGKEEIFTKSLEMLLDKSMQTNNKNLAIKRSKTQSTVTGNALNNMSIVHRPVSGPDQKIETYNCSLQEDALFKLTQGLLTKFPTMNLKVDSRGKVTAEIPNPGESLNRTELEMLKKTITETQKRIDMTPGTSKEIEDQTSSLEIKSTSSTSLETMSDNSSNYAKLPTPSVNPTQSVTLENNIKPYRSALEISSVHHIKYHSKTTHEIFTYLTQIKSQQYLDCLNSHLLQTSPGLASTNTGPRITNVFSLNQSMEASPSGVKRQVTENADPSKRIRVKSPSKLNEDYSRQLMSCLIPVQCAPVPCDMVPTPPAKIETGRLVKILPKPSPSLTPNQQPMLSSTSQIPDTSLI